MTMMMFSLCMSVVLQMLFVHELNQQESHAIARKPCDAAWFLPTSSDTLIVIYFRFR